MTSNEMREAIQTMILNRIDVLQADVDATPHRDFEQLQRRLARLYEAKYIIAMCTDTKWFEPRKAKASA